MVVRFRNGSFENCNAEMVDASHVFIKNDLLDGWQIFVVSAVGGALAWGPQGSLVTSPAFLDMVSSRPFSPYFRRKSIQSFILPALIALW